MNRKFKDQFQFALAIVITVCFFALMVMLLFYKIPTENVETLNLATGALLTAFGTVVGFFFGSSYGSSKKTDLMLRNNEDQREH